MRSRGCTRRRNTAGSYCCFKYEEEAYLEAQGHRRARGSRYLLLTAASAHTCTHTASHWANMDMICVGGCVALEVNEIRNGRRRPLMFRWQCRRCFTDTVILIAAPWKHAHMMDGDHSRPYVAFPRESWTAPVTRRAPTNTARMRRFGAWKRKKQMWSEFLGDLRPRRNPHGQENRTESLSLHHDAHLGFNRLPSVFLQDDVKWATNER